MSDKPPPIMDNSESQGKVKTINPDGVEQSADNNEPVSPNESVEGAVGLSPTAMITSTNETVEVQDKDLMPIDKSSPSPKSTKKIDVATVVQQKKKDLESDKGSITNSDLKELDLRAKRKRLKHSRSEHSSESNSSNPGKTSPCPSLSTPSSFERNTTPLGILSDDSISDVVNQIFQEEAKKDDQMPVDKEHIQVSHVGIQGGWPMSAIKQTQQEEPVEDGPLSLSEEAVQPLEEGAVGGCPIPVNNEAVQPLEEGAVGGCPIPVNNEAVQTPEEGAVGGCPIPDNNETVQTPEEGAVGGYLMATTSKTIKQTNKPIKQVRIADTPVYYDNSHLRRSSSDDDGFDSADISETDEPPADTPVVSFILETMDNPEDLVKIQVKKLDPWDLSSNSTSSTSACGSNVNTPSNVGALAVAESSTKMSLRLSTSAVTPPLQSGETEQTTQEGAVGGCPMPINNETVKTSEEGAVGGCPMPVNNETVQTSEDGTVEDSKSNSGSNADNETFDSSNSTNLPTTSTYKDKQKNKSKHKRKRIRSLPNVFLHLETNQIPPRSNKCKVRGGRKKHAAVEVHDSRSDDSSPQPALPDKPISRKRTVTLNIYVSDRGCDQITDDEEPDSHLTSDKSDEGAVGGNPMPVNNDTVQTTEEGAVGGSPMPVNNETVQTTEEGAVGRSPMPVNNETVQTPEEGAVGGCEMPKHSPNDKPEEHVEKVKDNKTYWGFSYSASGSSSGSTASFLHKFPPPTECSISSQESDDSPLVNMKPPTFDTFARLNGGGDSGLDSPDISMPLTDSPTSVSESLSDDNKAKNPDANVPLETSKSKSCNSDLASYTHADIRPSTSTAMTDKVKDTGAKKKNLMPPPTGFSVKKSPSLSCATHKKDNNSLEKTKNASSTTSDIYPASSTAATSHVQQMPKKDLSTTSSCDTYKINYNPLENPGTSQVSSQSTLHSVPLISVSDDESNSGYNEHFYVETIINEAPQEQDDSTNRPRYRNIYQRPQYARQEEPVAGPSRESRYYPEEFDYCINQISKAQDRTNNVFDEMKSAINKIINKSRQESRKHKEEPDSDDSSSQSESADKQTATTSQVNQSLQPEAACSSRHSEFNKCSTKSDSEPSKISFQSLTLSIATAVINLFKKVVNETKEAVLSIKITMEISNINYLLKKIEKKCNRVHDEWDPLFQALSVSVEQDTMDMLLKQYDMKIDKLNATLRKLHKLLIKVEAGIVSAQIQTSMISETERGRVHQTDLDRINNIQRQNILRLRNLESNKRSIEKTVDNLKTLFKIRDCQEKM